MVGILKAKFRKIHTDQEIDWKEWIYLLCLSYNMEVHSITGSTPYECMMGAPNFLTDYKGTKIQILDDVELEQKLQAATRAYARRNYHSKMVVGDTVFTRNSKPSLFDSNFEEEMVVVKMFNSYAEVEDEWGRSWRKPLSELRKKGSWEGRLR